MGSVPLTPAVTSQGSASGGSPLPAGVRPWTPAGRAGLGNPVSSAVTVEPAAHMSSAWRPRGDTRGSLVSPACLACRVPPVSPVCVSPVSLVSWAWCIRVLGLWRSAVTVCRVL